MKTENERNFNLILYIISFKVNFLNKQGYFRLYKCILWIQSSLFGEKFASTLKSFQNAFRAEKKWQSNMYVCLFTVQLIMLHDMEHNVTFYMK